MRSRPIIGQATRLFAACSLCFAVSGFSPRPHILVYDGDGVSPSTLHATLAALRDAVGCEYDVHTVDAATLARPAWPQNTSLIVVPGGRDLPYLRDLSGPANAHIRAFVEGGGSYLGLCAGGYYGAAAVSFAPNDPVLRVVGARPLAFFAETCAGPVFDGFAYNSERGARAARLHVQLPDWTESNDVRVYYNGGGAFVGADRAPNTQVLATYADADDKAAIVLSHVGAGRALLTGVHPELTAAHMPADAASAAMWRELSRHEMTRQRFWRALLQQLNVTIRTSTEACKN